jgi:hypothetical protein
MLYREPEAYAVMSSPAANLNRFIFFPQGRALTVTLLTYVLLFALAAGAQYTTAFSEISEKLAGSGANTIGTSCLYAAAICAVLLLTTYVGIVPYYISGRQSLVAMPGSAMLALAVFFIGWSALQLLDHQSFVLFTPEHWSAKITLNNLSAAGILALLSPIGLRSSIVQTGVSPHNFTGLHQLTRQFRTIFDKGLKPSAGGIGNGSAGTLDWESAKSLHEILLKMQMELDEKPGNPMQPVAREAAGELKAKIKLFIKSYQQQTGFDPNSYAGGAHDNELLQAIETLVT